MSDNESESSIATVVETELDVLIGQMTTDKKSSNTIRSYKQQYRKLREYLKKDVSEISQAMIIQSIDKITDNNNSRAALLNIAIVVRKLYEKGVDLMEKRRVELKKNICVDMKVAHKELAESLPPLSEFDQYIDFLYDNGKWQEYVINYLIRNAFCRNQDLVLQIVRNKKDMSQEGTNYLWIGKNKVVFVRRDYKTFNTYGEKTNEFKDMKFRNACMKVKGSLIPNPENPGYYVKLFSFKQLGEGSLMKMIVNQARLSGDLHKLKEISKSRGTSMDVLAENYNVQEC